MAFRRSAVRSRLSPPKPVERRAFLLSAAMGDTACDTTFLLRRKIAGSREPGARDLAFVAHRGQDVRHQTIRHQTLAVSLRDDYKNAAEPLPVSPLSKEGFQSLNVAIAML